jgi:GNAT superfamily N-acetyltransferase
MNNQDGILQDLSDTSIVTAIESNLFESCLMAFEKWQRAELHDDTDMFWSITDIPFPAFNMVLRARLSDPNSAVEAVITRARQRNVPLLWWIGPSTQPSDLGDTLATFGFIGEEAVGMAVDLYSLPEYMAKPQGLVIERVDDTKNMEKYNRTARVCFEIPDFAGDALLDRWKNRGLDSQFIFRAYVGLLNGEPVATSSMFLGAGVAGIYSIGTIPEKRRQGIGFAMTLRPLLEARKLGYRVGILQASKIGEPVYKKIGFREYCKLKQYIWLNQ